MDKLVYVIAGGDMECHEIIHVMHRIVSGENNEEIVKNWCKEHDIDFYEETNLGNYKFNVIEHNEKNDSYCYMGRKIVIIDVNDIK